MPDGGRTPDHTDDDLFPETRALTIADLQVELVRTRNAVTGMRQALSMSRRWTWLIRAIAAVVLMVAFFTWRDATHKDNKIEDLARTGFLANCEASNENRLRLNEDNIEQAELLVAAARRAGSPNVAAMERYLDDVRRTAENHPPRDCTQEVNDAFD